MLLRVGVVVLGLCLTLGASADDVIECTTDDDKKGECVKLHLCRNGVINDDGANIIDIRFNPDNVCEDYLLKCCAIPEDEDDQVLVPPSTLPQQPVPGNQPGPNPGSNPGPGVTGLNAGGVTNGPGSSGQSKPPPTPDALDLAQGKPKPSHGAGGGGPGVGSCNCKGSGKCCGTNLEDEQLTLIGGDLFPGPGKPTSDNLIKETHPQQPVHGGGPPTDIQIPNPSAGTGGPIGGQSAGGQGQGPAGAGGQYGAGPSGGQNAGGKGQKPVGTGGQPVGAGQTGGQNAGGQGQGPSGTGSKPSGTGQGQGPTGTGGQPAGVGPTGGQNAGEQVQKPVGTGGQPTGAGQTGGQNAGGQGQGPSGTGSKPSGTGQGQGPTGTGGQPAGAGPTGGQNAGGQGQKPVGTGGQPVGAGQTGGQNAGEQVQKPVGTGGQPVGAGQTGMGSKPSGTGQGQGPTGTGGQPAGAGPTGGQKAGEQVQKPVGSGGQPTGAGQTGGQNAGGQGQGPTGTGSKPSGAGQGQGPTGTGGQPAGAGPTGGQNVGGQGQKPVSAGDKPGAGGTGPSVGQSTAGTGPGAGAGAGKQPGYGGSGQHGGGAAKPSPSGSPSKGSGGGSKDRTGQGTTQSPFTAQPLKCGLRNVDGVGFRITGDKDGESEYGEFPWMVAILKQEKALDQIIHVYQCGGSLIHPSVVLTAAHCVQDKSPQDITLRLGEWDTQTKNEIFDYQDRKAVEIVTHPEFYKGGLFNDVALVFLDKPAELMDTVNTICLPPADFNFDASRCFASGWGKDVFGKQGTYQVILKKIELPVMPRDQCQTALRTTRLGRRFKLHGSFICAGGEKGRDTCKGDGGSPLVCPIPGSVNHYYQAGMVAWGIGCGEDGIPGVYVNVPLFRGWIEQHLTQRNISHSSFQYA